MKIGITCYPTFGGSGVLATELGKALAKRDHEIHFIAYALPHRLDHIKENLFFHEVSVNTYPLFEYPPYSLALTSKMIDVVRHAELELLHVHYAIPHATSAVQAREILGTSGIRIPVVTTLHGTDITLVGQDQSYAPVVTHSINESDGVTAVSEYLRRETLEQFDVRDEIKVIPNFVDTSRFRRQSKQHFKDAICPDGEQVVVHVSNFRPVKRTLDVIRIFARLLEEGPSLKLLLVGDGPDRIPAERLARELEIFDHCRFLGKQEPVEEILSIGDLFLMPSGSESFGLAALEAMACSVPIVTSNIGGLPELNVDGVTGYLCDLDDLDGFVDRCQAILTNDDLHEEMASAARVRAVEEFDISKIAPRYEAYYSEAADRMGVAPGQFSE